MSMELFALKGHKVMVTKKTKKMGLAIDLNSKYLEIGKIYTVDYTDVAGFSTDVYLLEFPKVRFNSVNFLSITKQTTSLFFQHKYWKKHFPFFVQKSEQIKEGKQ